MRCTLKRNLKTKKGKKPTLGTHLVMFPNQKTYLGLIVNQEINYLRIK
jgi:hypothetical protein